MVTNSQPLREGYPRAWASTCPLAGPVHVRGTAQEQRPPLRLPAQHGKSDNFSGTARGFSRGDVPVYS